MNAHSAPGNDFEQRYAAHPDPWQFETRRYEQEKYATTLRALGREHYPSAFEPGCSIGVLTQLLAARCDHLLAMDVSPTAVGRARSRCAHLPQVLLETGDFQAALGVACYDLIVMSELGYYFTAPHLQRLASRLSTSLRPGGELLAVHWLGDSPDHVLHGDDVHDLLHAHLPLTWQQGDRHPGYRVDRWIAS